MCRNGDIYITQLAERTEGSLQSGMRPAIVISNDKANEFSSIITIVPVTGSIEKKRLPTHVYIKGCGLSRPSIAMAEQITSIDKSRLRKRIGSIKKTKYEKRVKKAIEIQLDL